MRGITSKVADRPAAKGQCEAADERPPHEPEFGKRPEYQIVQCHRMTGPFGLLRGSFPVAVRWERGRVTRQPRLPRSRNEAAIFHPRPTKSRTGGEPAADFASSAPPTSLTKRRARGRATGYPGRSTYFFRLHWDRRSQFSEPRASSSLKLCTAGLAVIGQGHVFKSNRATSGAAHGKAQ
jgi:hypothetical protein